MATVSYDIHALDDPFYRSSDGKPMSENTTQYRWIVAVQGGLATQFSHNPDVLVVGDLLWYPVEGDNKTRAAPDAMVVFGRPKGDRGSYIQYREAGVAPQVAFEILSPSNRPAEMRRKLAFYERYGIQEYYILDPDYARHRGYLRSAAGKLEPIAELFGWVSPLLSIRFEMTDELILIGTDGLRFEFYEDEALARRAAQQEAATERRERQAAEQAAAAERRERQAAEQAAAAERRERQAAEQAAAAARDRGQAISQENERLRAKLKELGLDPDS